MNTLARRGDKRSSNNVAPLKKTDSSIARFIFFAGIMILSLSSHSIHRSVWCASQFNVNPPASPVRLIFIHHSCGENWLADDNGGLGMALRDNRYYVSDTNYGWGPDSIGDTTDIGHWWLWFRGPRSTTYLSALYSENGQHCSYSRLSTNPGGENLIIMFKSCFPNSALEGSSNDPVPQIGSNPLRGEGCSSPHHTVANAKGIYIDLLEYFRTRQDKLFIVITAPPQSDPTLANNTRAFNMWLVNDWLRNYAYRNVFVFDFYNVLTTNGGNPNTNDLNQATGNHHRWWNNAIQHKTDGDNDSNPNVLEYPSAGDDDHPSKAGNLKATGEFLPLLNIAYNNWKSSTNLSQLPTAILNASARTVYFVRTGNMYDDSALGFVYAKCLNPQNIIIQTDSTKVNQVTGAPLFSGNVVLFGGRAANKIVKNYEDLAYALITFSANATHYRFMRGSTVVCSAAISTYNFSKADYFAVQIYMDGTRFVFSMWGIERTGTYASGLYFADMIYPSLASYTQGYLVCKWTDLNNDGIQQSNEIAVLASGT